MAKRRKIEWRGLVPVVGVAVALCVSVIALVSTKTGFLSKAAGPAINKTVREVVVFEPPQWGQTGVLLTDAEIASRFDSVLYSRSKWSTRLAGYRAAGFGGKAMVVLTTDVLAGPANLASVAAQKVLCTAGQKAFAVWSNYVDMDTGDFCEIHDAIISHTTLADYPDLVPSESWFLHLANGNRISGTDGSMTVYRPNSANAGIREYFKRRVLRESARAYGAYYPDGVFLSNVDMSWGKLLEKCAGTPSPCPLEYPDAAGLKRFVQDVKGLVAAIKSAIPAGKLLWADLADHSGYENINWSEYLPYLDGAMDKRFALGSSGVPVGGDMRSKIDRLKSWSQAGKTAIALAQGKSDKSYFDYALGLFLLATDGVTAEFNYNNNAQYQEYYDDPKLAWNLGLPSGSYTSTDLNHESYSRSYACGSVNVWTRYLEWSGTIKQTACVTPTPISPTPAVTCFRTGCNKEVCSSTEVFNACLYRPEYACNEEPYSTCKNAGGVCTFVRNSGYAACMANYITPTPIVGQTQPTPTPVPVCAYGPYAVPGRVEAENFTCGGKGVAYYDTTTSNQGGTYRTSESVDIQATRDIGGGYNVGWTRTGEWMKYRIGVSLAGKYNLVVRAAATAATGKFRIKVDGVNVSGQVSVPVTSGSQVFRDVTVPNVSLTAGQHTLELAIEGDGANYNYIQFNKVN